MVVQLLVRGCEQEVGTPAALVGWTVDAKVLDFVCEVELQQCFKNTCSCAGEAIYSFPLDDQSSVCSFKAEFDSGCVINGVVKERNQAVREYECAKRSGQKSSILQRNRPDFFNISIGNIAANEHVKISLMYFSIIRAENEEEVCFVFPTSLAPLYSPKKLSQASESPSQHPAILSGQAMRVLFQCGSPIVSLSCPSHASEASLAITTSGSTGTISLSDIVMGRDIVMRCKEAEPHEPHAMLEVGTCGSATGVVALFPSVKPCARPHEFFFVVDRSGSMRGARIREAAEALKLFLRGLPSGSFFDVVGFGSAFAALFGGPRAYDDAAIDAATHYADQLQADMGGTEILAPLVHIFATPPAPGRARSVFVLTDGGVGNPDAVFAAVQAAAGDPGRECRVFGLGIGDRVSRLLVDGIARAGGGTARYVTGGAATTEQVLGQLKAALTPALTAVAVRWNYPEGPAGGGGAQPQHVPSRIPPVLDRSRFICFAVFPPPPAGRPPPLPESVTVSAQTPAGPLSATVPVRVVGPGATTAGAAVGTGAVGLLAARASIREFDEGRRGPPCATSEEALALALRAGLVTAQTALVAVEQATGATVGGGVAAAIRAAEEEEEILLQAVMGGTVQRQYRVQPQSQCEDIQHKCQTAQCMGSICIDEYMDKSCRQDCGRRIPIPLCCIPCVLLVECAVSVRDQAAATASWLDCLRAAAVSYIVGKRMWRGAADGAPLVDSLSTPPAAAPEDSIAGQEKLAATMARAVAIPAPSTAAAPAPNATRTTALSSSSSSPVDSSTAAFDGAARVAVAARLCLLQRADGRFPGGKGLAAALGLAEEDLRAILAEAVGALGGVKKDLLPTLVAVAAMRGPLEDQRCVWELMEAKAVAVLQGPASAGDGGVQEAAAVLGRLLAERMRC